MEYATFRKWLTERGRYGFCEPAHRSAIHRCETRHRAPMY